MNHRHVLPRLGAAMLAGLGILFSNASGVAAAPTRVLLVTGGHDYDTNEFHQVFAEIPNVTVRHVVQRKAQEWLRPAAAQQYDVMVLYDMWGSISEEAKTNFIHLIQSGKGLVATHHCLASYQDWPEFRNIVGGKYHQNKYVENGVEKPASTYLHDVDFRVHVVSPDHPVTRGVSDFAIHDETYGGFSVNSDVTPLLTTTEPTSSPTICWTHSYGKGKVVYLELGHDRRAYANPNYVRLVTQAIQYVKPVAKQ